MALDERFVDAASQGRYQQVLEFLRKGCRADYIDTHTGTPVVSHAIRGKGDLRVVRLLVDTGADVNVADAAGETPLMSALRLDRRLPLLNYLIDVGAHVNAVNQKGECALHFAVMATHPQLGAERAEYARLLLERGADPNGGEADTSPLKLACLWGRKEIGAMLLDAGAEIDRFLREDDFWRINVRHSMHERIRNSEEAMRRLVESHALSRNLAAAMTEEASPSTPTPSRPAGAEVPSL